jgi:hypothetical protein
VFGSIEAEKEEEKILFSVITVLSKFAIWNGIYGAIFTHTIYMGHVKQSVETDVFIRQTKINF